MAIPIVPLALGLGAGALFSGLFGRRRSPQYVPTEFEKKYMDIVKGILEKGGLGMPEDLKKRIYGLEAARLRGEALGLANTLGMQLGAAGTYTSGMPALVARDIGRSTTKRLAELGQRIEEMDWRTRMQTLLAALGYAPRLIEGQRRAELTMQQLKENELEGLKKALSISIPLIMTYLLNPFGSTAAASTGLGIGEIVGDFFPYIG